MADASPSGAPADARQEIAQHKFACPACGAEAVWNPSRQALVCPFCGTTSPARIDATGAIVEHDLVAALRGVGDDKRGWQIEKRYVKCRSCQAISVMDAKRQAQRCEFCGSAELVPYTEAKDAFRPESVLPFTIGEDKARDGIRAWYGRLWLAPNKLKRAALTDTVKGVYLPYWTFDASADASWTAEAGHYYYTTETYTDGSGRTQTRQVRQTRWEPAAGRLQHVFDDDLVCASVGVHPELLRGVEPFPTGELKTYDAAYVAGWIVERYQIDLVGAAKAAREAMDEELRRLCAAQVPGDIPFCPVQNRPVQPESGLPARKKSQMAAMLHSEQSQEWITANRCMFEDRKWDQRVVLGLNQQCGHPNALQELVRRLGAKIVRRRAETE